MWERGEGRSLRGPTSKYRPRPPLLAGLARPCEQSRKGKEAKKHLLFRSFCSGCATAQNSAIQPSGIRIRLRAARRLRRVPAASLTSITNAAISFLNSPVLIHSACHFKSVERGPLLVGCSCVLMRGAAGTAVAGSARISLIVQYCDNFSPSVPR